MRVILPSKGDVDRKDSMVGDRNAMGVASEILEDVLGAAEGWLAVHDPVLSR
jgi:hypothetical protein